MKHFGKVVVGSIVMLAGLAGNAMAEGFTLPELPTTNLELAGTAVAGLVAVYVCIRVAIRVLKGA